MTASARPGGRAETETPHAEAIELRRCVSCGTYHAAADLVRDGRPCVLLGVWCRECWAWACEGYVERLRSGRGWTRTVRGWRCDDGRYAPAVIEHDLLRAHLIRGGRNVL